jgi:hypothetical protein
LFYNPNTAQHLKQAQIADIDSRIAKLEQLVGFSSGDNVDSLVSDGQFFHTNISQDNIQFSDYIKLIGFKKKKWE